MIAGHLREKSDYFHMALSWSSSEGKAEKSVATGLKVRGNKTKATNLLNEIRRIFDVEAYSENPKPYIEYIKAYRDAYLKEIKQLPVYEPPEEKRKAKQKKEEESQLFSTFLRTWLAVMRKCVDTVTFGGYQTQIEGVVIPYFEEKQITLRDLKALDIQRYYEWEMDVRGSSANTVIRRHANIRKALQYACDNDLVDKNVADRVQKPTVKQFEGDYYTKDELEKLFEVVRDKEGLIFEYAVIAGAFYGLRRSEVVGLRWKDIDFENKTVSIRNVVTTTRLDGKQTTIQKERTKNKSSCRTLPLVPQFEDVLLRLKAQQQEYQRVCGNCYCWDFKEYIMVNELGVRIEPAYITQHFKLVLLNNGLRVIRYHDLRHSCASLLYACGVDILAISKWLGHSTVLTTTKIYMHMDFGVKLQTANALGNLFSSNINKAPDALLASGA